VVLEYQEKRGEFFWNIITTFPAEYCDGDFVGSLVPARARIAA